MRLLAVLLVIFILRLPSWVEPHWYGDEGIYLALAQAMNRGAVLYRDIWDNKTPLLYLIYAISPTLLWAKISATIGVLGTTAVMYFLAKKIKIPAIISSLLVGILLSLPVLEGNIANAELYFTLPIILGAYLIFDGAFSLVVGFLVALAFLIKVPAVFDFAGMFLAFSIINLGSNLGRSHLLRRVFLQIKFYILVAIGFVLPVLAVFLYFYFNKALPDFLTAAFGQNAAYVAVDTGPLTKLSNPLFVKGIILIFVLLIQLVLFVRQRITKELFFLLSWFGFSLYGSLLSGRPYPHYLLQVVPPMVILLVYLASNFKKYWFVMLGFLGILGYLGITFGKYFYPVIPYYKSFFWGNFTTYFDWRTTRDAKVATFIKESTKPSDPIFYWGDDAFIYVLSERPPATKFIQAHHLTTIAPKNYDLIIERLQKLQPKYVLISRPVQFPFPKLENFVKNNYQEVKIFDNLYIYQNVSRVPPSPFGPNY